MNILLISTNIMTDPYPTYPIGLDYVAHAIASRHQVRIVDMNEVTSDDMLVDILVREQPDLIGLSIRNIDTTDSTHVKGFADSIGDLIHLIRNHTQAKVVLGGSG
ncbi:MAG TPA: cobalamin B12-binding domain-containing protein, partial [Syntrophales bacterium]|nr:cobalamin B12-binding domain-containing protein [Syntrophales bacterium]